MRTVLVGVAFMLVAVVTLAFAQNGKTVVTEREISFTMPFVISALGAGIALGWWGKALDCARTHKMHTSDTALQRQIDELRAIIQHGTNQPKLPKQPHHPERKQS